MQRLSPSQQQAGTPEPTAPGLLEEIRVLLILSTPACQIDLSSHGHLHMWKQDDLTLGWLFKHGTMKDITARDHSTTPLQ